MIEAALADGRILEFPEGTDPNVIQKTVKNMMVATKDVNDIRAEVKAERGEQEASFLESMGRGMLDVYQGAAQLGNHIGDYIKESPRLKARLLSNPFTAPLVAAVEIGANEERTKKYDAELSQEIAIYNENNPDFSFGRLLGGIATPLSLIPGGAQTTAGRSLLGAAAGAVGGAFQPVEDTENFTQRKLTQAGFGAALGGALPVGGALGKKFISYVDEALKPLYSKGVYRDVSKWLKETFEESRDDIERALRNAVNKGDDRTVADILAEASKDKGKSFGGMIVRLERDLAKESDAIKSIYDLQDIDHKRVLSRLAGTQEDFVSALENRKANAVKNYAKANQVKISADNDLIDIVSNKFARDAMRKADDIAEARGINKIDNLTEYLHLVKEDLDAQLKPNQLTSIGKTEATTIDGVKKKLVGWLESKNGLYREAREQYMEDSIPINRMQIGAKLKDKFIDVLDDSNATPSSFAREVRKSLDIVTDNSGKNRFNKLDDVFEPDEVMDIKNIIKRLGTRKRADRIAAKSKSKLNTISSEVTFSLPHILSRPVVITNHVLKLLSADKSPEYRRVLNSLVTDPKEFLKAYRQPSSSKMAQVADRVLQDIRQISSLGGSQEAARLEGQKITIEDE